MRASDGPPGFEPISVYVPTAALGPLTAVAKGSAIVAGPPCGVPGCPRTFPVYYEGVYETKGVATFADRAAGATRKLRECIPTYSRVLVRAHDLERVGVLYEPPEGAARIELVRDAHADDGRARTLLSRWLGIEEAALDRQLKSSRAERRKVAREGRGRSFLAPAVVGGPIASVGNGR